MTGEVYESWRWGYWPEEDHVGGHSIKKETAISKAITIKEVIEIVIIDQLCDRDQVGEKHTMLLAISKAIAIKEVIEIVISDHRSGM